MQHPYPTQTFPRHSNNNPTPPGFSPRHMQCYSYQQKCLHTRHHPPQNMHLSTVDINLKNIKAWAILDSGASSHFLVVDAPVINKQVTVAPISVTLPDGDQVHSTYIDDLDMPQLPKIARVCHIIPDLASYSLILVLKLCEAGCEVSFTKWGIGVEVRYRGRLIITGSKFTRTGLWMVPLSIYPSTATSSIIKQESLNNCSPQYPSYELYAGSLCETSLKAELAMYHHQSLGSPPKSNLLQAIRRHPDLYSTFPGLNYELIRKHLPPYEATEKGHMIQRRQGINSTSNNKQEV